VAEPVRLSFLWRPTLRDPDDDMVLEAAVNGRADAIVTFNHRDFVIIAILRQRQRSSGLKSCHREQLLEFWSEHHEEVQFRATTSTFLLDGLDVSTCLT
jgi:hypothetical protein